MAIWGNNISDGGLKLALEMDLPYAIDLLESSMEETIRHRNAYYISKGNIPEIDETIPDPMEKYLQSPKLFYPKSLVDAVGRHKT